MTDKKKTKVTLDEVQDMKGKTQWAKLVADEKSASKNGQPAQKPKIHKKE